MQGTLVTTNAPTAVMAPTPLTAANPEIGTGREVLRLRASRA